MNRQPVSSSHLRAVGYDATALVLEAEFTDGSVYQYYGVAQGVYQALMSASSKGGYFAAHVKERYRYQRTR